MKPIKESQELSTAGDRNIVDELRQRLPPDGYESIGVVGKATNPHNGRDEWLIGVRKTSPPTSDEVDQFPPDIAEPFPDLEESQIPPGELDEAA